MKVKCALLIALSVSAVCAQTPQPNSNFASMAINGVWGGPWPNLANVRTSLPAVFDMGGATNQPYLTLQTTTTAVGTYYLPANNSQNSVDLTFTPFPVIVLDGFKYPAIFNTGPTGQQTFGITVPAAVPIGLSLALQTLILDPFSSIGATLTAATQVTVTQGPTILTVPFSPDNDEGLATITLPAGMTVPFYGTNKTNFTVCSNGYLTFGSTGSDFTPTASQFNSGPPRMAGFWTDMAGGGTGTCKSTVDSNPGPGLPAYAQIDFTNWPDWLAGTNHTFSMVMRTDGTCEIIHSPTNNSGLYDVITGFGPGGGLSIAGQKNFVGPTLPPPGNVTGPGILTTPPSYAYVGAANESFFEWWGIQAQHLYYANPYDNPYDMYATTLHFLPNGPGGLPGSSNQYILY